MLSWRQLARLGHSLGTVRVPSVSIKTHRRNRNVRLRGSGSDFYPSLSLSPSLYRRQTGPLGQPAAGSAYLHLQAYSDRHPESNYRGGMEPMKCPLPLDRASFAPLGVGQLAQFCPSFRTSPMDSEKESIGVLFFRSFLSYCFGEWNREKIRDGLTYLKILNTLSPNQPSVMSCYQAWRN